MSCNYKKTMVLVGILCAFLVFFWYVQNSIYIRSKSDDILVDMNGSVQGFNSIRAYAVYYALFYLLFMNMRLIKEEAPFIVAHKSRSHLFFIRAASILESAGWFSLTISAVNLGLTYLFVDHETMADHHFYKATLLNGIALVLFYGWVGLLCKALEDRIHSFNIAVSATFILVALTYFFVKMVPWLPISDMRMYEGILVPEWDALEIMLVFARQLGLVIVFCLIGHVIFLEKDFIRHEN